MSREYIILPKTKILPDSSIKRRTLDDNFWINMIHYHILKFYKEYDNTELKKLIEVETEKKRKQIEDVIKDYIKNWLETNNKKMFRQGILLNLEPKVKYNQVGFYDLKFQHSDWVNSNTNKLKYYPIECKNLYDDSAHLAEYVFNSTKNDGGVYRYFNGKYAQEQDFGGMLGFILGGQTDTIKEKIIQRLKGTFNIKSNDGFLAETGITLNSIENNPFTFSSKHKRNDNDFILFHLLFQIN